MWPMCHLERSRRYAHEAMRYVALDFETTGVVAGCPNEPWQLGLVAVEDGRVLSGTKWETLLRVDPARPFSPRAPGRWAELRNELEVAPAFMDIWPELAEKLAGAEAAGCQIVYSEDMADGMRYGNVKIVNPFC